jgi:predicted alpha/beta hydrolase family esterase
MAWGSEFMMIGEAGHINSASGFGDWPEGLALLNTLRKTPNKSEATEATVLV